MHSKKKVIQLIVIAFMVPAIASSWAFSASSKIDPALILVTRPGANLESATLKGIVQSVEGAPEPLVKTIVKFDGDLLGIESYGGKIGSVIGNIATVEMPVSAVEQIAQLPDISYIEAARKVRPLLDVSVPETGADSLRSGTPPEWTGYTGHNVIIGIVDTGIDLHHKDFKDSSGKTRILSLWDQTATLGKPPSGFSYGKECSSSSINAGTCTEKDTVGHGTHVAGIAAGNGSATGHSMPAYRYVGMAPEADLIVVKADLTTVGILDGIAYIQKKARDLGKPSVINLSLGSHFGPHDGTSLYEQGLDAASGLDSVTGMSNVIVGAAGNEADAAIHASGTVITSKTTKVNFTLYSQGGSTLPEVLDLWTAGTNTLGISVTNGACSASVAVPDDVEHDFDTGCGLIAILSSSPNVNNGDREILVGLFGRAEGSTHSLQAGSWSFSLTGTDVPVNGRYDVWAAEENSTFDNPDPSITIVDTSTASKTISVASYNTKDHWDSLDGSSHSYGETSAPAFSVGDISFYSSIGPRRSCSNVADCPAIQKPEIAAPGMGIMSSLSANTTPIPAHFWIDPDDKHIIDQGTSMAAPHVTGAVALLLQKDPTQTSDQIKSVLFANTRSDSFTGPNRSASPDDTWGYGKLDVQAAASALADYSVAPLPPTGLVVKATATDTLTVTWKPNTEPYLHGYNLYQSTTQGIYTTPLNDGTLLSQTAVSYKVTGLTKGTKYYYVLTAVNFAGQESSPSAEVSAVAKTVIPVIPSSGGSGGHCFIATAAYGSYLDPHVKALRLFRDRVLLKSAFGRMLVDRYYAWSPPLANFIAGSPFLRLVTRLALTPLVLLVEYPALLFLVPFSAFLIFGRQWRKRETSS